MWIVYKLVKGFLRALVSAAAPWQLGLGAALGVLLGCMPLWLGGPNPLALAVLLLALVVNCHLGSVFLLWGAAKLLALAAAPLALLIGNAFDGVAQAAAGIPLLHASGWSHTGWLGLALLGILVAPEIGFLMALLATRLRARLQRLAEDRRLALAGKVGGNSLLMRFTFWFLDL